jgi:iron complex transport system permease protein
LLPSAPVSTPRKGAPAAAKTAGKKTAAARKTGAAAAGSKARPAKTAGRTTAGKATAGKGGKGKAAPPPPGPGLVVGQVPVLARVAGVLGALGALVRFAAAIPALASTGDRDLGGLDTVWDLVPPLPILLVVGGAGVLAARGVLPRLGLAVLLSAGTLAAGLLLSTLALFATGSRSTVDLPLGIGTSVRYEPGAGLVLLAVAYGLLVAAAVAAGVAWSTTVMEDDGAFDTQRPRVATWGLIVGVGTALAFGMAPYGSSTGLDPGTVPERAGLELLGGLLLTLGAAVWAVVAATLRPRLAVAGAYAGLAAVLAAETLGILLLAVRSPAVETTAGTVGRILAVSAVTTLAVAVRGRRRPAG